MERLRTLRKQKGITMKQLGAVVGVSESAISLYETGNRQPDNEQLKKFADYFGVTTDYLLERTDDPQGTTANWEQPPQLNWSILPPC